MVLFSLGVGFSLVLESYLVLVLTIGLVVAHNMWAWRKVDLYPISKESAELAAEANWWLVGIAAFLKLFSS